jgi:hypothetical protein
MKRLRLMVPLFLNMRNKPTVRESIDEQAIKTNDADQNIRTYRKASMRIFIGPTYKMFINAFDSIYSFEFLISL